MASSGVQFDFTGVSISYGVGPTVVALTQQMQIQVIHKDTLEQWQPSGAQFDTVIVLAKSDRGVHLSGGEIDKIVTIPSGVPCTIVGTIKDAKNGTGAGAITLTLINAIKQDGSFGGQARKFAQGGVDFIAYSVDGTTDPMTLVVATGS